VPSQDLFQFERISNVDVSLYGLSRLANGPVKNLLDGGNARCLALEPLLGQ